MSEPPAKKPLQNKEEMSSSSSQGKSTSSLTEQESQASSNRESPPYDSFVETVINQTLNAMKPSSVNIEKQPQDNIIVVNMERPCSCEICSIVVDTDEKEKNQTDQQPTEEEEEEKRME